MTEVKGKCDISAKVLADSVNMAGNRLTTYEIEVPRIVWAEFLTHGMVCRAAASSRAIPFAKMKEQLRGKPVRFGQANPGMQDKGEDFNTSVIIPEWMNDSAKEFIWQEFGSMVSIEDFLNTRGELEMTPQGAWAFHRFLSVGVSEAMYNAGLHKQVFNRPTEAHQMIKAVTSATEWSNFFWLRKHAAADPTLEELARCMFEARKQSEPQLLLPGQWHLPYIDTRIKFDDGKPDMYDDLDSNGDLIEMFTLEDAIKVSCARTAAVSFRNEDYGLEQCLKVYDRLIKSDRVHASATQHCATPMKQPQATYSNLNDGSIWEDGVSHMDKDGKMWSAQYKGFVMYRKLIPNENYTGEIE